LKQQFGAQILNFNILTGDEMWICCWDVETRKTAVAAREMLNMKQILCPVIFRPIDGCLCMIRQNNNTGKCEKFEFLMQWKR
jgi:hypothetical protein